jgi:hypothetical protein
LFPNQAGRPSAELHPFIQGTLLPVPLPFGAVGELFQRPRRNRWLSDPRMEDSVGPRKRRKVSSNAAPYVLRQLLDNVPLDSDGSVTDVHITCVEYWSEYAARDLIPIS